MRPILGLAAEGIFMTAKKINTLEIKKMIKSSNVVIGTEITLKGLKLGKVQKVLLSSNCPARVEKDITHYSSISGAELHKLDYQNDELGVICKKPFSISVIGFLKGAAK